MELLPLVRCPCRRADGVTFDGLRTMLVDDIMGLSGYELRKTVKVKSTKLGAIKFMLLMTFFIVWVGYYGIYSDKLYLSISPVTGDMRMQLQHPVKHCNPMHNDCKSAFRDVEDMAYCLQSKLPEAKTIKHREKCAYMDEFDLVGDPFQSNQAMIPLRTSVLHQKRQCESDEKNCDREYNTVKKITTFNADVENFTLLIDHSMILNDATDSFHAWGLVGFIRPCGPPYNCTLRAIPHLPNEKQHRLVSKEQHDLAKYWFGAKGEIPLKDGYKLPNGDVFRIGFLFEMLGIDLDRDLNLKGESLREEGLSLMVEIRYTNFLKNTRPNQMPIVYEYRFAQASFQTYKTTHTRTNVDDVPDDRIIDDVHGVYLVARQHGHIGSANIRNTLLMILEATLVMGFVKWIVTFLSLNWFQGKAGDDLEHIMEENVDVDVLEADMAKRGMNVVSKVGGGKAESQAEMRGQSSMSRRGYEDMPQE